MSRELGRLMGLMGFTGVTLLYSRSQHLTVLSSEQEKR